MKKDARFLWKLFTTSFSLSAFTLGGGYVIVPLMQKTFVEKLGWLEEQEMLDMVAIGQSAPGVIAVNTAILAGSRLAGAPGAAAALLGTVLPPLLILSVVSVFYNAVRDNRFVAAALRGMQAGVAAVIADVVSGMGGKIIKSREAVSIAVMIAAFLAAAVFKVNVALVILAAAAFGTARALLSKRKGGEAP